MITLCVLGAMKGTVKEKIYMILTSLALDSIYILPMVL